MLAGYPGGGLQRTAGKTAAHDRLLILVTEMTAPEPF